MTHISQISPPDLTRKTWGNWKLDTNDWYLIYIRDNDEQHIRYEIDLLEIRTSAAILDWIFQVCGKQWISLRDQADLIEAFRGIFDPQANVCSWRTDKQIDPRRLLTERYKL
jgi:hypothetical protein